MPVTPIVRVTLPNGRWARLHMASVDEQLEILELPESNQSVEMSAERIRYWRERIAAATVETSWGGGVTEGIGLTEFIPFINAWLSETEEAAVPLGSGTDSDTASPKPPSARRTARPGKSRSRTGGSSST